MCGIVRLSESSMSLSSKNQQIIYSLLLALILLNLPIYFFFVRPEIEADAGEQASIRADASAARQARHDVERPERD